jgi:hypothetical protein
VERRFGLYFAESGDGFMEHGRQDVDTDDTMLAALSSRRIRPTESEASPERWHARLGHVGPQREGWLAAAHTEVRRLQEKGVYTEVSAAEVKAHNWRPVSTKWVFTEKANGTKKGRVVVRGDMEPDLGLETYAATIAARTYRLLCAVAAKFGLDMIQYDTVAAFCNAPLPADEVVVVRPPSGFHRAHQEPVLWKLKKALYGLRRAPLLWYQTLRAALNDIGLITLKEDSCVASNGRITVFWHVDDLIFMYHPISQPEALRLMGALEARFELTGGGPATDFLKIEVTRDRVAGLLWLSQPRYAEKLMDRFSLPLTASPPQQPLPSIPLVAREEAEPAMTKEEILDYLSRAAGLNWAAMMTRPDLSKAVSTLMQFAADPTHAHVAAANWCMTYYYHTRHLGVQYGTDDEGLTMSDASMADCPTTRRSSEGFITKIFGGPIAWRSARQTSVVTSTTHAELKSLSAAVREQIALNRLMDELELVLEEDMVVFCDNLQTLRLVTADSFKLQSALKHVDIHRHWLREEVARGRIRVDWVPTAYMLADGLTKNLVGEKFRVWRDKVGLVEAKPPPATSSKTARSLVPDPAQSGRSYGAAEVTAQKGRRKGAVMKKDENGPAKKGFAGHAGKGFADGTDTGLTLGEAIAAEY